MKISRARKKKQETNENVAKISAEKQKILLKKVSENTKKLSSLLSKK